MSMSALSATGTPALATAITAGRLAGTLFAAEFALMWTTFFILSAAIGWPASLDDPASVALPRLLENQGAVLLGYGSYLLAALLFLPAAAAFNARLGLQGPLAQFLTAVAVLAALAKAIGISRWLFAMPGLAEMYVAPGADQSAIAIAFEMLNAHAGGIGEILGVGLFSGVWTVLAGWALLRQEGRSARLIGTFALIAGLGLFLVVPAGFGFDLGPILTVSNILWLFALLALGLWCAFARPAAR